MRRQGYQVPRLNFPLPRFGEQYDELVKSAHIVEKMKNFGVRIDIEATQRHIKSATERLDRFTEMFIETSGLPRTALGDAGLGTTNAVKHFFREAKAPDVSFDKDGKPKLDALALLCLAVDYPGETFSAPAAALLGIRKALTNRKFAQNYFDVAQRHEGRIHFDHNPLGTKGARWSSSARFWWRDELGEVHKPSLNAQNIPARGLIHDFGPGRGKHAIMVSLRDCVIPDPGCVLAKFDFEGAEATLIAYNSGDRLLLEFIRSGADIHTETAKIMFTEHGIPPGVRKIEKDSPWHALRVVAKFCLFGGAYQAPSKKGNDKYPALWKQWKQVLPDTTESYFNVCMARMFRAYSGLRAWQHKICEQVDRDGFVVLPQTGKTIYLAKTAQGKNRALNFFMQSGLGSVLVRAIHPIADACTWKPGKTALLLQVHDEPVMQVEPVRLDEICTLVKWEMEKPTKFDSVEGSVRVEAEIGPNWGATKIYRKGTS